MLVTVTHFTSEEERMEYISWECWISYLKHDHWPCLLQEAPEQEEAILEQWNTIEG